MAEGSRQPGLRGRRGVAAAFSAGPALVGLVFGVAGLVRDSFMPYHAVAVGMPWDQVAPHPQVVLRALMELAGGGWLALGALVLLLMAFPIRRGERWARFAVPVALLLLYVPALLATLRVLDQTPASPPWHFNAVACLSAVVGFLLDTPWTRS